VFVAYLGERVEKRVGVFDDNGAFEDAHTRERLSAALTVSFGGESQQLRFNDAVSGINDREDRYLVGGDEYDLVWEDGYDADVVQDGEG
jgi:hypothetical protein